MADTNTNTNPDFIALDMDPTPVAQPADDSTDDMIALDMGDAPSNAAHAIEAQADTETPSTLASTLADIVTGSDASTRQVSGSLADGTMRAVGFSTAEGYVTALANGVKRATADSYLATLRLAYGYNGAQLGALKVTIIPEVALPVGPGIVHMPTGPDIFSKGYKAPGTQVATEAAVVAVITPGTLIANLLQDRKGKIFGAGRADRRATHRTRAELVAALETIGRADLAPRLKTSKAQFGEVMRSLNAPGQKMKAWNVTRADVRKACQEWPADLASRWCVGVLDGTDSLGSLGDKVLIADLTEANEIRFIGGSDTLRQKVTEAFTARIGEQTYNATDILNWFRAVMTSEFHMVQWASFMFIPGNEEQTGPVCAFVNALRGVMSRSIGEIDAVTGEGLLHGLAEGLSDEISEIEERYELACDLARKRDRAKLLKANPAASDVELELCERRAVVLPEAATSLVRALNEKADKVKGYETMLGTEVVKPVRDAIASLRATLEPLCDSTSAMAAVIELD
jgi:hypothetical protein